jgi:DHA1 family multidrug resistance protein-like MFS transporter
MNLWSPAGNQGVVYGLDTSVNAAARSIAPMLGAAVAVWFGLRGVFGATMLVYAAIVLFGLYVMRARERQHAAAEAKVAAIGDD